MKKSSENHPDNSVKIGKITEPKGLSGEVKIHLFSGQAPWAPSLRLVTLRSDSGVLKEYEIEGPISVKNSTLIMRLKGIRDRTSAESLKSMEVFISEDHFQTRGDEKIFLREILGFKIFSGGKEIGIISGFETNNSQDLMVVQIDGHPVLIPLIKEFLIRIDFEKKAVLMALPEGLLEVNRAL